MSGDPGDLANMADLALPPAIPFWSPAAGVWIVGAAAVAALAVAGWRSWQRYRADAYLRQAEAELARASSVAQVSAVLKRAALVAFGRERVASLTGRAWSAFLRETAPARLPMDRLAGRLDGLLATGGGSETQDSASVSAEAHAWLRGLRGRVSRER